jgi:hypothetical protein
LLIASRARHSIPRSVLLSDHERSHDREHRAEHAHEAAEAPTLPDALVHAPAAAAPVVAAPRKLDRKMLRLAHTQLRDAVGEATTKLEARPCEHHRAPAAPPCGVCARSPYTIGARPPTPRRWPRLEKLALMRPGVTALEALGPGTWGGLRTLALEFYSTDFGLSVSAARALAATLRRMPALRALELRYMGCWTRPRSCFVAPRPRQGCAPFLPNKSSSRRRRRGCSQRRAGGSRSCAWTKCRSGRRRGRCACRSTVLCPPAPQPGRLPPGRGRPSHSGQRALAARGARPDAESQRGRRLRRRARRRADLYPPPPRPRILQPGRGRPSGLGGGALAA